MTKVQEIVQYCQKILKDSEDVRTAIEIMTPYFINKGWRVDGGMYKRVFLKGKLAVKVGDLHQDLLMYRSLKKANYKYLCPRSYYSSKNLMVQQRVNHIGWNHQIDDYSFWSNTVVNDVISITGNVIKDISENNVGYINGRFKIIDGLCGPADDGYDLITSNRDFMPRMGGDFEGDSRSKAKINRRWAT
jgi:hypothetical protein